MSVVKIALLLILVLAAKVNYAADLPQAATVNAYRYLDLRERTNNNDAPEIDRFLAYLGLPKGLSWCAAFAIYNYKEASDVLRVRQPFPRLGRVSMLRQACISNPIKYRYITADEVRLGSVQLRPGDLPLWAHGTVRGGDFNGHTGLVIKQLSTRKISTIEGNTMPGPGGNQREGGGVYIRERVINPGTFRILGFCRAK